MTTGRPTHRSAVPQPTGAEELVTLLDEQLRPCGSAPKHTVHGPDTPLHLAFSCWVLDDAGNVLLTRRAAVKRTWPGVWTNTFCGHPAPGEAIVAAVHRRARQELGAVVTGVAEALPTFRYRAVMDDGTVENEFCPVFTARLAGRTDPDPAEIGGLRWVPLRDLDALLTEAGAATADTATRVDVYSPWMRMQWEQLRRPLLAGLTGPAL